MRLFWGMIAGAIIAVAAVLGYLHFKGQENAGSVQGPLADFDAIGYFNNLQSETFRASKTTKGDLDVVIAAIPDNFKVEYDSLDHDASSGATTAKNVRITMVDEDKAGLSIDELKFWGLDGSALAARIKSERLDETLKIVDRVEAVNMDVFGLEHFYQPVLDASTKAFDNDDTDLAPPVIEDYELRVGRVIMQGVDLHPYIVKRDGVLNELVGSGKEGAEFFHLIQTIAAITRSYSIDDLAFYDFSGKFKMVDPSGIPLAMDFKFPLSAVKGTDKGDYDYYVTKDLEFTFDMNLPMPGSNAPSEANAANNFNFNMDYVADLYQINDLRLGKIADLLAHGIMPDKSETDLFSLGKWVLENERYQFNDKKIYSVEKAVMDLSDFHGFMPKTLKINADNVVYDFAALIEWAGQIAENSDTSGEFSEQQDVMNNIISILEKNDFSAPAMDFDLNWDWSPDTGKTAIDHIFAIRDFSTFSFDTNIDLPTYDQLPEDFQSYDDVFEGSFALNNLKVKLADEGGIRKGFAMAVDFANLMPEDAVGANFLRGADPKDLRVTVATMVRFGGAPITGQVPAAKKYITAVADFIGKGGALVLTMDPPAPLSQKFFEDLDVDDSTNPEEIIRLLGFDLERKP